MLSQLGMHTSVHLFATYFIHYHLQIERPRRDLSEMLPLDKFPKVEVYVVTYSEPVAVVQATVTAALNLTYPGDRLAVCVLDDGRRDEVASMVEDLCKELRYMGRGASLRYAVREKRKGVPHHAKAGNINSTLLKGGHADAEFVLVLDCDMIAHPHFLLRTVGHFYEKRADGEWELKSKAALLQTPQVCLCNS
jgi:cellulose synthase (UDP-forming)